MFSLYRYDVGKTSSVELLRLFSEPVVSTKLCIQYVADSAEWFSGKDAPPTLDFSKIFFLKTRKRKRKRKKSEQRNTACKSEYFSIDDKKKIYNNIYIGSRYNNIYMYQRKIIRVLARTRAKQKRAKTKTGNKKKIKRK